jgi:hypothetical protein
MNETQISTKYELLFDVIGANDMQERSPYTLRWKLKTDIFFKPTDLFTLK